MNKSDLLTELRDKQYVMIKPSSVHGIGVFATKTIPKGCRDIFSPEVPGDWERFSFTEVASLPPESQYMIETYCLYDETHYFVPANGFKKMDLALYLNHSDKPNVASIDEGAEFEALREILPGEELLVDYGTLVAWE